MPSETVDVPQGATTPEPVAAGVPESEAARSQRLYHSSRTFLARMPDPRVYHLRVATVIGLLLLFFVAVPAMNVAGLVPDYKVNVLGKYLCFTIVALGIDLIWGYTGMLSLCQALFFCLGGYAMAMHLSLPQGGGDVRPEYNNIPQFMFFNNVRSLPFFWKPFGSFPVALAAGVLLPGIVAAVFGFFIFRSRVRGVYFSIVTQAVAWGAYLLVSRNEMLLGGTNGLTNFSKPLTEDRKFILGLYLLTLTAIVFSYLVCRAIVKSRLGRVLVAVRDKETRLYFSGYKPYAFKVFAFAVAAMLAGVGGMLYAPQVTLVAPYNMTIEISIIMVIWVAVGGRGRLWGAILGAMLVNYTYVAMTSDLATLWPYVQGVMFIGVVLLFPDGFVGLWDKMERQVAAGAGAVTAAVTVVPLASLGLFVMAEALGLMPRAFQKVVFTSPAVGDVKLKYVILLALLVASALYQVLASVQAKRATRLRGFELRAGAAA